MKLIIKLNGSLGKCNNEEEPLNQMVHWENVFEEVGVGGSNYIWEIWPIAKTFIHINGELFDINMLVASVKESC